MCQISIALEWRSDWDTNSRKPGSLTFEIADFEDRCTRLGGRTLQLGTMNLYEALRVQILPEEGSNGRLQLENSLIGLGLPLRIRLVEG